MKYLVLTAVGMWSAFLTVAQSFRAYERLLVANSFSTASLILTLALTVMIGFGYTMFFVMMIDSAIPRMRTVTYCLVSGLIVFLIALCMRFDFMLLYIRADMFMRLRYDTAITGLDYGNSVLLGATAIWWSLIGLVLVATIISVRRPK